jgi:AbrB family transcriptional regulator (stage V sporulation protein T)
MKATGIVRRIDDLGRVVIPKEIRRTMRIREGDPLEIYTDKDGEVIFKKYSPMGEMSSFALSLCETLAKITGRSVVVSDRDAIVAAAGPARRELNERRISPAIEDIMERRQIVHDADGQKSIPICDGAERYIALVAAPIITEGDVSGCVIFAGAPGENAGETELKLAQTVAGFLSKQMES